MSQDQEMFIAMLGELGVIIIAIIILLFIRKKYLQKRHRHTLLLFYIFSCFLLTIFFTWLSKIILLSKAFDYVNDETISDPLTIESFFILRIIDYRISFTAFAAGTALTYVLRVNLFDSKYNLPEKLFIYSFGTCIFIYEIFIYSKSYWLLGTIGYVLLLSYVIIIYVPFTLRCIKAYRGVHEIEYKKGFLSLTIMSLAICSILIFNMLDIVYIILYDISFTVYYYFSLISIVIGYLGAYFGYIKPRTATS
ncbi:MAG: hypothetical protein FK734_12280 [Asgard group archaeon]|nr:hypothetical protein [Asgard group archaeon]